MISSIKKYLENVSAPADRDPCLTNLIIEILVWILEFKDFFNFPLLYLEKQFGATVTDKIESEKKGCKTLSNDFCLTSYHTEQDLKHDRRIFSCYTSQKLNKLKCRSISLL